MKRKQKSKKLRQKIAPKLGVMIVLVGLLMGMVVAEVNSFYFQSEISGEILEKLTFTGDLNDTYNINGFAGDEKEFINISIFLNSAYPYPTTINVNLTCDNADVLLNWSTDGEYTNWNATTSYINIYPDETIWFIVDYKISDYATSGMFNATITLT